MANLSMKEKATFEELFEMNTGYVIDFSNSSFARFIGETINIDIYNGPGYTEYSSKANKLRQIWNTEPNNVVGTLLSEMLAHYEDFQLKRNKLTEYQKKKIVELNLVCQRLLSNNVSVQLPQKPEESLQTLIDDINSSLARNKPELVLDRLHTFSTKLLRQICEDNGIVVKNEKGEFYPLHSLAGMLKKYYSENKVFQSKFTLMAIQTSISLFDAYNDIRNNQSYAHDNEILDNMEASFAVKSMADLVTFIDSVETYRKKQNKDTQNIEIEFDIPF